VTIEDLAKAFEPLKSFHDELINRESFFVKTLEEHFAHHKDGSKIDANLLICWGIALCKGDPTIKAGAWWDLIQD
jgi:hypothetical protein